MQNNKLAKEDKIAIAVAILAFLTISVLMTSLRFLMKNMRNCRRIVFQLAILSWVDEAKWDVALSYMRMDCCVAQEV
mgnify:CR=1 FL=1